MVSSLLSTPTSKDRSFIEICIVQDMRYFVDAPSKAKSANQSKGNPAKLELLKGITGYAAPGVLTALMGGSGTSFRFPVGACKQSKDK